MSNFSPSLSKFLHVNCNSIEKHIYFFSPICFSFSRNNVCKKTALLLAYTKKSTTLCFQVLIIRSTRVVNKLHHVFLAQVLALVLSL